MKNRSRWFAGWLLVVPAVWLSMAGSALAAPSDEERKAADLLADVAQRRFAAGQFDKALALLEQARDLDASARVLELVGRCQVARGQCDAALQAFEAGGAAVQKGARRDVLERYYLETLALCHRPVAGGGSTAGMVKLPEASFTMGSDDGEADEQPPHPVTVSTFWIDRSEVTVDQFHRCVTAGVCEAAHFRQSGDMPYCNYHLTGRDNYPMNCVDFTGAQNYCRFAGKRLPTEAEWERAARGAANRLYPWGGEVPGCERLVMKNDVNDGCGEDHTFAVGSKPMGATPEGVVDLAGNVWEWVSDWYDAQYYAASPARDPKGPAHGSKRAMRGSSWLSGNAESFRGANRDSDDESYVGNGVGFRCALDAQGSESGGRSFWTPWQPNKRPKGHGR